MEPLRCTTELGLKPDYTGKVRDIFDLGSELFIVSTDRISAYDVIMNDVVPGRGVVLSVMTLAWLNRFADVPNHLLTANPAEFPAPFDRYPDQLGGRSVLVRKAERFPVECVVRGYLTGSGWRSYQQDGTICGIELPAGLQRSQQLAEPLFTPSTKAEEGHDENIPYSEVVRIIGEDSAARLQELSLRLYSEGLAFTAPRGVLLADTKFEFGIIDGQVALIDEVLTPDSSRFWPAAEHRLGEDPPSWDKQILRNHLDTLDWNQEPPPPELDTEILKRTASRYREVLAILFPAEAAQWQTYLP
ncbi:MAG: phosphoribosylaminoimidazolesuccinocarboxamide synthase [bacterium]